MTLGFFDLQLLRITRISTLYIPRPSQFTRTDNARGLPDLPIELPRTYSHGTRSGYAEGCRCVGCASAMRSQVDNRRQARQAAGLCRDCGVRAPLPSKTRCASCRERHNQRSRASHRQKRRNQERAVQVSRMRNFRVQPPLPGFATGGRVGREPGTPAGAGASPVAQQLSEASHV